MPFPPESGPPKVADGPAGGGAARAVVVVVPTARLVWLAADEHAVTVSASVTTAASAAARWSGVFNGGWERVNSVDSTRPVPHGGGVCPSR
jgi:hypothetical protein